MAEEVVCTGWLKKSPPAGKMPFGKFWKDRWCVLKKREQQHFLEYYKNEWATKPKGIIDLSKCSQVAEGLEFENRRNLEESHVFTIVTSKRTFYLVTTSEEDMRRWTRNLCRVCGFNMDDEQLRGNTNNRPSEPISIPGSATATNTSSSHQSAGQTPTSDFTKRSPSKAVSPLPTPDPGESYIHLNDCMTGLCSDIAEENTSTENQYQQAPPPRLAERQISTSSIPESPPPPPPVKSSYDHPPPPIVADDTYDVPPIHSAGLAPIDDSDGIYKFVPPPKPKLENNEDTDILSKNFERQISKVNSNVNASPGSEALSSSLTPSDTYDIVPPPRPSNPLQFVPGNDISDGNAIYDIPPSHADDIYDVPPSHGRESPSLYDVPPSHQPGPKLLESTTKLSTSTDALAKEFTKISLKNQGTMQSDETPNQNGTVFIDDEVPPPTPPRPPKSKPEVDDEYVYLVEQTAQQSNYDIVPPPRPLQNSPKTLNAPMDIPAPPPRPPKPPALLNDMSHSPNMPSTPPPSFDDRFRLSESTVKQGVPEEELTHKLGLLQTQSGTSAESSANEDDYDVPPLRSNPAVNNSNDKGYLDTKIPPPQSVGPAGEYQNLFIQRPGYVEMKGGYSTEVVETLDTYVPMATNIEEDTHYTKMGSTLSHPVPPPASQLKESSRRSQQPRAPPPVNRSLKPRKYQSTGDLPRVMPPLSATSGNFYATRDDVFPVVGTPVESPRTRSFGKAGFLISADDGDDRDRSDTLESSSSSSDGGDGTIPSQRDLYEATQPKFKTGQDHGELYMKHDPRIYQNSEDLKPMPLSPPPPPPAARKNTTKKEPVKKTGEVQYIDLDLEEPSDPAPPRPARAPPSPETEYTSLDMERTIGLQDAMRQREKDLNKDSK
ncbi:GRB2-associated-binding protein 1-like isoform X2 [Ptychodera flava]|uniref:GRB2-associated-binding protein 1-like isoform X2 n=1 Tax=Ptychodera flava TaxID=63121 RepID=UPI003969CFAF